jgi:hypothetical protein
MTRIFGGSVRGILALLATGLVFVAWAGSAVATSPDRVWEAVEESGIARSAAARQIVPQRYRTVRLDLDAFESRMRRAPQEHATPADRSDEILWLPLPDGQYEAFRIAESPVMDAELARRYPQIRTWVGAGVDDPGATLRFDLTPKGFHAQILSEHGTSYIDPFQPGDRRNYIAYHKRDHDHGESVRCSVTGQAAAKHAVVHAAAKVSSGATLRTYRTAIAATGEYTQFHGGGVVDALAAIVTTLNRVNGIYEREVGVRMVLVADNDAIIYTNPASDPYDNDSGDLGANVATINSVIGSADYDIGHLVGTGGGGVASLGSVCTSSKASGLTGSGSPVGDAFDVDYVAHEMGHQFAGNHTFNGSGGNCSGGNRNAGTAYEPGSGVSIQAYAGICGADNLQPNSEDFFTRASLNEIIAFTTSGAGGTCGSTSATGNAIPTVTAPADRTIPRQTPFELTATGSDANGDTLSYQWEQFDLGAANAAGSLVDDGNRPIFRSFAPSASPTRTFPSLRYILGNANAVPVTAPLPGTASPSYFTGEVLPSTARTLRFRVTVRDNRAGGGGTNEDEVVLTVSNGTGPFVVTAPNSAVSWAAGSNQTVTWNVAGTNGAPVNTANVRIRLSLDGGNTWPTELAANEANDGSANVTIPAGTPATTQARIRVEAVGNIYFDVSDANFSITGANTAPAIGGVATLSTRQGSPTASGNVATVSDAQTAAGAITVAVSGAPDELAVSALNLGGTVQMSATASCTLVAPSAPLSATKIYPVLLRATDADGAGTTAAVNIAVGPNLAPTLGTYGSLAVARETTTPFAPSSAPADANGNFAQMTVTPSTLPGGGTVAVAPDGTVTVTTTAGTSLGTYPIEVRALDSCDAVALRRFELTVASSEPALEIVATQVLDGNGVIEPEECNAVSLSLRNAGTVAATAVSATLSSAPVGVSLTQAVAAFDDIPPGETRTSLTPFQIGTDATPVCFSSIPLDLEVTYAESASPFESPLVLEVGRPEAVNYSFTAGSGATIPAGGTLVPGSAVLDGVSNLTVPAGFSFSVYGETIAAGSTLRATTTGVLQLSNDATVPAYTNTTLPASGAGDFGGQFPADATLLMPYWDDMRLDTTGGGIYTNLVGSAPNRNWIVEWRGKAFSTNPPATTTVFAVVFTEGQDGFEYLYGATGTGGTANGASATIGIQAATTGEVFTQYSFNQAVVSPGTRLTATRAAAICSAGAGSCTPPRAVIVTESGGSTSATEGGGGDTYTLVLSEAPDADVTITIEGDADVEADVAQLVFTVADWDEPQTVTVSAIDDRTVEGAHAGTLAHTASGGGYDDAAVADVEVVIGDDDSASYRFAAGTSSASEAAGSIDIGVVLEFATSGSGDVRLAAPVTVPFSVQAGSTATGSGVDYSLATGSIGFAVDGSPQAIEVTLVDDALDEPAETLILALGAENGGGAGQQAAVTSAAPASHTLTITDNDEPVDVAVLATRNPGLVLPGGEVSFEVTLNNLSTGIDVASADFAFVTVPVLENVAWTCIAEAGADCPAAGTGLPAHAVVLDRETGVNYSISGEVPAGTTLGSVLEATASIAVSAPYVDTNPSNNVSETTAGVGGIGIFSDGFETPPPP